MYSNGKVPVSGKNLTPGQPISRILSSGKSRLDDHLSGARLSARLTQPTRDSIETSSLIVPAWPCSRWGLPGRGHYCPRRWSLTPPFHPYRSRKRELGGLFLWPDPATYAAPDVIRHRALWSADFPRISAEIRDHPASLGFSYYHEVMRRGRQIYLTHVKYAFVKNLKLHPSFGGLTWLI